MYVWKKSPSEIRSSANSKSPDASSEHLRTSAVALSAWLGLAWFGMARLCTSWLGLGLAGGLECNVDCCREEDAHQRAVSG